MYRLSSDGRFLFNISCNDERQESLQIYDLERGDICIWTSEEVGMVVSFDFCLLQNGNVGIAYIFERTVVSFRRRRYDVSLYMLLI